MEVDTVEKDIKEESKANDDEKTKITNSAQSKSTQTNTDEFKMPPHPPDFLPKKKEIEPNGESNNSDINKLCEGKNIVSNEPDKKKRIKKKEKKKIVFPYKEPEWSGVAEDNYSFEVLKNGIIIDKISLNKSPYIVIGRLKSCDIPLIHQSVSRYHAVIQYKASDDESKGFYIFDLGSSHGTYVNKMKITANVYVRLKVGYIIKFGGSSRMFVLLGPSEDEEPESDLSVTEIKELAKKRAELAKAEEESKKEAPVESDGIDWGMGDDAEDIGEENPFAINFSTEELNLEDPKKTLRGWFEREGCELEYKNEELGPGHFSCRIELPICDSNGKPLFAEATLKGKKKEVNVACALEACRILDQHGLLRQAHHESHQKKRKWEETDFYASDEDTYLDRTGTIEKKRIKRKMAAANKEEVETYDTIKEKLAAINKEISEIEAKLAQDKPKLEAEMDESADSLDSFLNTLAPSSNLDKATKSKLKLDLSELNKQRERYERLANIAKPAQLPPLESKPVEKKTAKDFKFFIGKRKGGGNKSLKPIKPQVKPSPPPPQKEPMVIEEIEEEDEDEEMKPAQDSAAAEQESLHVQDKVTDKEEKQKVTDKEEICSGHIPEPQRLAAEHKPKSEEKEVTTNKGVAAPEEMAPESASEKLESKPQQQTKRPRKSRTHKKPAAAELGGKYDDSNPNYAVWIPPEDQTGDGITHLNAKFGY